MQPRCTHIFTADDIMGVFGMQEAVAVVEDAFMLYGRGEVQMPPKVYMIFEQGDLRTMPVYLPKMSIAGVKNVNVHPANKDIPAVMATITLVDPEDGYPVAIMDGTYLTSLRTGAAGGVAAKHLARPESEAAGFVGAGHQAHTQLDALMVTMAGLRRVSVFDPNEGTASDLCRAAERYGLEAVLGSDVEQVVAQADILTTTTPVREPIVRDEWVRPGTHINAIGADAEGKQELDPAILKRARIVIDNWEQASHSGEINVPLAKGLLNRDGIACDIGELLTGAKTGRQGPDDVTVFDSTGLAVQDVSCAFAAYKKLISQDGAALRDVAFF
jgi:alanine dehydrogenase